MATILLLAVFVGFSAVFLVGAFFVGLAAETYVPALSTLIFMSAIAAAFIAAWPLALWVTPEETTEASLD